MVFYKDLASCRPVVFTCILVTLVFKPSLQVAERYDAAYAATFACDISAKTHPWKSWPEEFQIRALHYRALAQVYSSSSARRDDRCGEEVRWFGAAGDVLLAFYIQ